jgi:hypothetical protein
LDWLNNGSWHRTGAGYGFRIDSGDRDAYFRREWGSVLVEMPSDSGLVTAEVNVDKDSFWGPKCRELISKSIGRWLIAEGFASWPSGSPPRFDVKVLNARRFRLEGVAST